MTCHEARDLYSALVDEALDAGQRAAVESHVAGCAECRRELERFRRTVALLQGAGPVHAPAGFVDRVLEAARPTPWYRQLARALFWPLGVKLPLEAAAMLLVAGIAVYVFQHSPELQQAARHEAPPPPRSALPSPAPTPPPSVSLPPGAGRVSQPSQAAPPAALEAQKSPAPPADTARTADSLRPADASKGVRSDGSRAAPQSQGARSGGTGMPKAARPDAAKSEATKESEATEADAARLQPAKRPAEKSEVPMSDAARPDAARPGAPKAQAPPAAQGAAQAPSGPAEAPASGNRARAESPPRAGAVGRTDHTAGMAKKTDQTRDSAVAEGKPAESRTADSRRDEAYSEPRAKEVERRAEGKSTARAPERADEPPAPPARQRILPPTHGDPPAGDRRGALAREEASGPAPPQTAAAPPAAAPFASPPPGASPPATAAPPAGGSPPAVAGSPPGAASAPRSAMKSAPAPASPPAAGGDALAQARPELRQETSAQMALASSADVAARLAVPDREAALRALGELLGRAGGREVSRRAEVDADALDVLVPRDRYADFLQSLAQVGRLSLEREPAAMPGLIRVILRIVHGGG